ncbi:MAG: alkane 1-monooxygenase [Bacteroidetes bacterium]|nr:alkane 1-monooxygenase [Bacteroidota bacterium]MBP8752798.1 alkane 1-monooxygenase [Chitinophagales bacterium]MBK7110296.1 alkane 1-monooxygenase [Bacteroidota bacterium]MBK8488417.1 alkane 1-monooxygenase [Bacteroidota bacterium]MBK8681819.1 alkane 1-monooxygenase [Bacteroidota bacterium]
MRYFKYILPYSIPLTSFISIYAGGIFSFLALFYSFMFLPLLELLLPQDEKNLSAAEEELAKKDKVFDWMLYFNMPLVYGTLIYFLFRVSDSSLLWWELTGMVFAMGLCCGVIGINVGHELGHRKNEAERLIAKLLLMSSLYMHFFIEHNHGHHKNVGTEKDPSSAKYNEPVYTFYFRTLIFSFFSAWDIQMRILDMKGQKFISYHNQMLIFMLVEAMLIIVIGAYFGLKVMLLFIAAAFVGILLLETINYIEHYGLRRKLKGDDLYERVMPWHSWNSNHYIGRMVLYELTRHSDHHYLASRKYQVLRHLEQAPQLPAGYPAMVVLSLLPPLWFRVMNKRVRQLSTVQHQINN